MLRSADRFSCAFHRQEIKRFRQANAHRFEYFCDIALLVIQAVIWLLLQSLLSSFSLSTSLSPSHASLRFALFLSVSLLSSPFVPLFFSASPLSSSSFTLLSSVLAPLSIAVAFTPNGEIICKEGCSTKAWRSSARAVGLSLMWSHQRCYVFPCQFCCYTCVFSFASLLAFEYDIAFGL